MLQANKRRSDKKWVGKGDCYEANFRLMQAMHDDDIQCELVHGVVVAPDFYEHMDPGTEFMHCWVEAKHVVHGWIVCDASLCAGTPEPFTRHDMDLFYNKMKPYAVVKMKPSLASMMAQRHRGYCRWNLHPAHHRGNMR